MRILLLAFLAAFIFFLGSCNTYQPADEAFFLRATDISVSTDEAQGSGSHKITELFLYVNNRYQGCYTIGKMMPIVSKGLPVRIHVFAGIKNNGIADTRIPWPFYDFLTLDTIVESGKHITRPFTFKYGKGTHFVWKEDFESPGRTIVKSGISENSYTVVTGADAFEGTSLTLGLENKAGIAQAESSDALLLPQANGNVYLELDYKCTDEFSIGLIGDNGVLKPAINLNPQAEWNKIYIQLSSAISTPPVSEKYKVYFRLLKINNPDARIFLDNIKLVYL
jgi:hypothetical protein